VDVNAQVCAVLCRVSAGLDLNLLYGFHHRPSGGGGDEIVHDADAIERQAVLNLARAGAVKILAGRNSGSGGLGSLEHARRRDRELHGVAATQRKVRYGASADYFG